MAEKNQGDVYTILDLAKETHDKKVMDIVEVMAEHRPVLKTAHVEEANSLTSHVYDVRKSLPAGTWTGFNIGIPVEGTQVAQDEEPMAICESLAEIDQRIIMKSPSPYKTRWNREKAFIEGMGQTFEDCFFYGNHGTDPKQFSGLATRYDAAADEQVIDEGGSGSDCTSIWVIEWGPEGAYLTYPTGSKTAGTKTQDLGLQLVSDGETVPNDFPAYVTHYKFEVGLVVADPDAVQRIANIELSGSTGIYDPDNLITAIEKLPGKGRPVIYVNRQLRTQMRISLYDKANVFLSLDTAYGKKVVHFDDIPVFRADAIISTEDAL